MVDSPWLSFLLKGGIAVFQDKMQAPDIHQDQRQQLEFGLYVGRR